MAHVHDKDQAAVRYLLGDLSETERDAFEEQLFLDLDYGHVLDALESDLIDNYIGDQLSSEQRLGFERSYLLSDSGRERVKLARFLRAQLFNKESHKVIAPTFLFFHWLDEGLRVPKLVWLGGFAILLVGLIGGWLFLRTRPGPDNQQTKVNQPVFGRKPFASTLPSQHLALSNAKPGKTNQRLDKTRRQRGSERTALQRRVDMLVKRWINSKFDALSLKPTLSSSESPGYRLSPDADYLRLQLFNDDNDSLLRYFITIRDPAGKRIVQKELPGYINREIIILQIPARKVSTPGNYDIMLTGTETVGGPFRVVNFYSFSL